MPMMLPFAQPIVEASKTNSPWLGCWQSERQEFENWPGRFATAARSQTGMRLLSAGVEGKRSQYANTKPCNFSPLHNQRIILLNWRTNTPLTFVQEIGELAEAEGHHPNISFGWGNATVSLQTKKIKGLHEYPVTFGSA